ncbi:MAG TPA: hypothetical protein VGK65_10795 [Candidatus Binatia bacterium]|jgi:hypothetical protein
MKEMRFPAVTASYAVSIIHRIEIRGDLSRNQIGLFVAVLLAVATLGTAFWIVPEPYQFVLIIGIFLVGIVAEIGSAKNRNRKNK